MTANPKLNLDTHFHPVKEYEEMHDVQVPGVELQVKQGDSQATQI